MSRIPYVVCLRSRSFYTTRFNICFVHVSFPVRTIMSGCWDSAKSLGYKRDDVPLSQYGKDV